MLKRETCRLLHLHCLALLTLRSHTQTASYLNLTIPPLPAAPPPQLLDDPLSAVDPRVGRVLFDRCITGPLMAGATRLLVTHQRQFLPGCDAIIVLRGGRIAHR